MLYMSCIMLYSYETTSLPFSFIPSAKALVPVYFFKPYTIKNCPRTRSDGQTKEHVQLQT